METTTVLSRYETITTVLSIIAICVSILIPLVQWVYKKWIATAIVKFYPTGQATLFFNQSGSYIRINGVVESERSAATIKKMSIVLTRKRDDRKLNLDWSFLISPVNANLLGNYVQTTEAAHPFRVEADSVACSFVEYSDPSDSSGIKIRNICSNLAPLVSQCVNNHTYEEALDIFSKSPEYIDAKNSLLSDFYWEIGKYSVDVSIEYSKRKTKTFSYEFTVTEQNSKDLRNNIDESLIAKLKDIFRVQWAFKAPQIEITERKA
ncbi:MAG: hypothetical protein IJH52_06520 [Oscillospiraceae bacterium]|nr:hypothetical protein [Oscillospiraceae bacterium]